MKLLVNQKTKALFIKCLLCVLAFAAVSAAALCTGLPCAAALIFLAALFLAVGILLLFYRCLCAQERTMEAAAAQVTAYLRGDTNARIPCAEEGELYRLFHEVNALAAVLNAHAENEARAKVFLQDTIANISHQLKTPLATLNIYNGILQGEEDASPTVREFAALSEQELDRMEALVQSLLRMAKLDAGTAVPNLTEQNAAALLHSVENAFAFRAKREGKSLTLAVDEALTLRCDRGWLAEAVGNLLKNALDHTKAGDAIRLSGRYTAGAVQLTVADNGSGIHPEDLPYIFKRFYRSRFAEDAQGVGLGLPLAKAIAEAQGGTLEVESELGKGTTFTFWFPIPTKL